MCRGSRREPEEQLRRRMGGGRLGVFDTDVTDRRRHRAEFDERVAVGRGDVSGALGLGLVLVGSGRIVVATRCQSGSHGQGSQRRKARHGAGIRGGLHDLRVELQEAPPRQLKRASESYLQTR